MPHSSPSHRSGCIARVRQHLCLESLETRQVMAAEIALQLDPLELTPAPAEVSTDELGASGQDPSWGAPGSWEEPVEPEPSGDDPQEEVDETEMGASPPAESPLPTGKTPAPIPSLPENSDPVESPESESFGKETSLPALESNAPEDPGAAPDGDPGFTTLETGMNSAVVPIGSSGRIDLHAQASASPASAPWGPSIVLAGPSIRSFTSVEQPLAAPRSGDFHYYSNPEQASSSGVRHRSKDPSLSGSELPTAHNPRMCLAFSLIRTKPAEDAAKPRVVVASTHSRKTLAAPSPSTDQPRDEEPGVATAAPGEEPDHQETQLTKVDHYFSWPETAEQEPPQNSSLTWQQATAVLALKAWQGIVSSFAELGSVTLVFVSLLLAVRPGAPWDLAKKPRRILLRVGKGKCHVDCRVPRPDPIASNSLQG